MDWNKEWKDLYSILEIPRDATQEEITKAYRNLMKKYHPDAWENKSEEEKQVASEKAKDINIAYEILNNEVKKADYDAIYDAKMNETSDQQNDREEKEEFSYEDAMKNYSEASKKAAERVAIRKLIESELEKSKLYLEKKNEIILEAYRNGIDKNEYYLTIQELQQLAYEYISTLEEMTLIAYDYDLLNMIGLIDTTKEYMIKEFEKLPMNEEEIVMYENKAKIIEKLQEDGKNIQTECDTLFLEFEEMLVNCYKGHIIPIDFEARKNDLESRIKDKVDYCEKLAQICQELELKDEFEIFTRLISRLNNKLLLSPTTYEESRKQGQILILKQEQEKINYVLQTVSMIIAKIENASTLDTCEKDFEEALELIETARKAERKIKNFVGTKESINEKINIMMNEAKRLYQEANEVYLKMKNWENTIYEQNLPSSIYYEGLQKEINLKELREILQFLEGILWAHNYKDIDNYEETLEASMRKARMSKRYSKEQTNAENQTFKQQNSTTTNQTDNQSQTSKQQNNTTTNQANTASSAKNQNLNNSSYTDNNVRNGNNSNYTNAGFTPNYKKQSHPYNDENLEKGFEKFLKLKDHNDRWEKSCDLWYEACNPEMWQTATWDDFFTGKRADFFKNFVGMPKYITEMEIIFAALKTLQKQINVGTEKEEEFLGNLMLIDYLLLEYEKTIKKNSHNKEERMKKNFGTPIVLATTKLIQLWMKKRNEMIIEQMRLYSSQNIVTSQYQAIMEQFQGLISERTTYEEAKRIIMSSPSIYIYRYNQKRTIQKVMENWSLPCVSNVEATVRNQYRKDKASGRITKYDHGFDDLENLSHVSTTIPNIFKRFKKIINDEFDFINLAQHQCESMPFSKFLQYIWQQLCAQIKGDTPPSFKL